jgi:hypothetical protein
MYEPGGKAEQLMKFVPYVDKSAATMSFTPEELALAEVCGSAAAAALRCVC